MFIQNLLGNWVVLAIAATVLLGVMTVILTSLAKGMSVPFVLLFVAGCWVVGFVPMVYREPVRIQIGFNHILILVICGALSIFGNLSLFQSAKLAPNAGLPIAIFSCQAVVVAVVAWALLGGKLTLWQIVGMIFCVAGAVIIKLGSE